MLDRFANKGLQQRVLEEVDHIIMHKKDHNEAINLLTNAILQNPDNNTFHEKLGEIASMSKSKNNQSDQEFPELMTHSRALAGFEAFVTALEQRHNPALKAADEIKTFQPQN